MRSLETVETVPRTSVEADSLVKLNPSGRKRWRPGHTYGGGTDPCHRGGQEWNVHLRRNLPGPVHGMGQVGGGIGGVGHHHQHTSADRGVPRAEQTDREETEGPRTVSHSRVVCEQLGYLLR